MKDLLKLVSVVGARPQFVKLAPVARAISSNTAAEHKIIHTGQHYDADMSQSFFEQLDIPRPTVDLGVGSARHGAQTADMLVKIEDYLLSNKPDAVIVYGDTNSTLAATLAASKMHIAVAHIEAGLRSFDRKMPEEINRIVADHCSDRLYAPTPAACSNLQNEKLEDRTLLSGDVMLDAIEHNIQIANETSKVLKDTGLVPGQFGVVTVHRPSNTTKEELSRIIQALQKVADDYVPLLLPAHPRTRGVMDTIDVAPKGRFVLTSPMSYLDLIVLIRNAAIVITDSGGVQKEAALLHTPGVTLRDTTEWVETIEFGVNRLVENDESSILEAVLDVLNSPDVFSDELRQELRIMYGNGKAANFIAEDLFEWVASRRT